ncbi:MAG: protein-glutamate O-methyltransferase [Desulfocapsaceae bacterium]|nr:protein-glutamate O-methyltransferase [Desulfocapsaceae bacterium]
MTVAPPARLRGHDFQLFRAFIYEQVGIQLPPSKKTMLEARLQKRLKALDLESFEAYREFIFSPEGRHAEIVHLIDVVTTNKTDFYREAGHFTYLTQKALPEILARSGRRIADTLTIWSAGCSSGEEPYTLAMVLSDFAEKNRECRFSILASDISTRILKTAMAAVYPEDRATEIAVNIKKKYFLRSKDKSRGLVRICPEIRSKVTFRRINFMDNDFGISDKIDIIFCRNVIIYFDKQTQQKLMQKFCQQLDPGGYLFLGHSETLNGIDVNFKAVGPTVYQKI